MLEQEARALKLYFFLKKLALHHFCGVNVIFIFNASTSILC